MRTDNLKVIDGASAGAWIKPRLQGAFGAVTLHVPQGFEAYARIFHPASNLAGDPVTWADVAKACGATPHREMQWHALLGLAGPDELQGVYHPEDLDGRHWVGSDPAVGAMNIEALDALSEILTIYTSEPANCFFGLCTIQNWEESFSAEELQPLLELPHGRNYIVLNGPLSAVKQIAHISVKSNSEHASENSPREAPNLIWPIDHSWLVASDVDFDSTLVGGGAQLIEAIVRSPCLEAWRVEPTDSLAANADNINPAKDRT